MHCSKTHKYINKNKTHLGSNFAKPIADMSADESGVAKDGADRAVERAATTSAFPETGSSRILDDPGLLRVVAGLHCLTGSTQTLSRCEQINSK